MTIFLFYQGFLGTAVEMKATDSANENNDVINYRINNNKTATSKSFDYKKKLIKGTPNNNSRLNA